MGKKKQKVRWTSVEENFFAAGDGGDDSGSESNSGITSKIDAGNSNVANNYVHKAHYFSRRGGHHYWTPAPLAPRFERKRASNYNNHNEMTVFIDGECCETEQLPDGFTKIRSKNLDVLFKRDYYAQRVHAANEAAAKWAAAADAATNTDDDDEGDEEEEEEGDCCADKEGLSDKVKDDDEEDCVDGDHVEDDGEEQAREERGNEEASYQPNISTNGGFTYSPTAPPFVPSSQAALAPALQPAATTRPSLFLYSPSSNTMIPCEEIIIPNPVMGPDGPVYTGPSNIYLAFPVDGERGDSGAYMAQPFVSPLPAGAIQYDQYGVPYTPVPAAASPGPEQQPQLIVPGGGVINNNRDALSSSDGGCSSTEPGSADSTTPHSPPDLSAYSPANWAEHFEQAAAVSAVSQCDPLEEEKEESEDGPSWNQHQHHGDATQIPSSSAAQEKLQDNGGSSAVTSLIPGLSLTDQQKSANATKRIQKRKRRRKQVACTQRGSVSSEGQSYERLDSFPKEREDKEEVILEGTSKAVAEGAAENAHTPSMTAQGSSSPPMSSEASSSSSLLSSISSSVASLPTLEVFPRMESIYEDKRENKTDTPAAVGGIKAVNQVICDQKVAVGQGSLADDELRKGETEEEVASRRDEDSADKLLEQTEEVVAFTECNTNTAPADRTSLEQVAQETACDRSIVPDQTQDYCESQQRQSKPGSKRKKQKSHHCKLNSPREVGPDQNSPGEKLYSSVCKSEHEKLTKEPVQSVPEHDENASIGRQSDEKDALAQDAVALKHSDGEWETKRRRSRKTRHNGVPHNIVVVAARNVDEGKVAVAVTESEPGPEVDACEAPRPIPPAAEDTSEHQVDASSDKKEEAEHEEEAQHQVKRPPNARRRRFRRVISGDDVAANKAPSTRKVLIRDGLFEFGGAVPSLCHVRRASEVLSATRLSEAVRRGHLDTLFVSSFGHGIDLGPLAEASSRLGVFVNHAGAKKYTPPDRADEIPEKYRLSSLTLEKEKDDDGVETQIKEAPRQQEHNGEEQMVGTAIAAVADEERDFALD